MILVDTSLWVEHLSRGGSSRLAALLQMEQVLIHPFIIGEIALGQLGPRVETLAQLRGLPAAAVATPAEVLALIESHRLFGIGVGYVDVHLLASARLMGRVPVWTYDKRMRSAAERVGLSHGPNE